MGRYRTLSTAIDLTGSAGSASGEGTIGIPGGAARLVALGVKYNSQPNTTDVTIVAKTSTGDKTILTLTNANTDVPLQSYAEAFKTGINGAVANTESPDLVEPMVNGIFDITVAQGDPKVGGVTVVAVVEL